jgi:hypothetical protein
MRLSFAAAQFVLRLRRLERIVYPGRLGLTLAELERHPFGRH